MNNHSITSLATDQGDSQLTWFPDEIRVIQDTCALRFLGYQYENGALRRGDCGGARSLAELSRELIDSLAFYQDDLKNFAVFFALQRGLGKWGGERLTKYSNEHYAFDFLFLHLYKREIPTAYQHESYMSQWNNLSAQEIENAAAFIRNSLQRRDSGPVVK